MVCKRYLTTLHSYFLGLVLSTVLREKLVSIENLYLDPNNPRYADITQRSFDIPTEKVTYHSVQKKAFERILDDRFLVQQLKDSILKIGFLPVDRLVVMELEGNPGKYLVIEGNRRLAAIKSLLEDRDNGEIDVPEDIEKTLMNLPVLVIAEQDPRSRRYLARVFQGVRHLSGVREWGPYQQAQIVAMMLDEGKDLQEICDTLGITKRRANILRKCYYAMNQMKSDPDYDEHYRPNLFSYFDDLFRIRKLREWMEWNDDENLFENTEHRHMFYNWIVGEEEEGKLLSPKISDHKEVRHLRQLMEDPAQFRRFCNTPTLRITDAVTGIATTQARIDWREILSSNLNVLNQIPALDFQHATEDDKKLLEQVIEICNGHLSMIEAIQTRKGQT